MPKMTPMTIPAMAPPLKPWLVVEADVRPGTAVPVLVMVDAVRNATVAVDEPVEVTVTTVALVGRTNAEALFVVVIWA